MMQILVELSSRKWLLHWTSLVKISTDMMKQQEEVLKGDQDSLI